MSNLGTLDRIARAIIGLVLIVAPFVAGWPTLVLVIGGIVGIVLLVTAAASFCPVYALLGLTSKRGSLTRA
jgi:hypothetical protein